MKSIIIFILILISQIGISQNLKYKVKFSNGYFLTNVEGLKTPEGYGICIWNTGDKYIGNFKAGKAEGSGVMIFTKGTIMTGDFKNNEFINGKIILPNGNMYIGDCKNSKPHGQGKMITDNAIIEGVWDNGKNPHFTFNSIFIQ